MLLAPPEPDDDERRCPQCGGPVDALLTVDSSEWDGSDSWIPLECGKGAERPPDQPYGNLWDPTQVTTGRGYSLQIYYCVGTPSHSPAFVTQGREGLTALDSTLSVILAFPGAPA